MTAFLRRVWTSYRGLRQNSPQSRITALRSAWTLERSRARP